MTNCIVIMTSAMSEVYWSYLLLLGNSSSSSSRRAFILRDQNRSHYAPGSHLKKWVFSSHRNVTSSVSGWRNSVGKVFHNRGPATAKLLSPSWVFIRSMIQESMSADCSLQRPELATSWQSLVRYGTWAHKETCRRARLIWTRRTLTL